MSWTSVKQWAHFYLATKILQWLTGNFCDGMKMKWKLAMVLAIEEIPNWSQCHDLAKWLSHYFILFSYLDLLQGRSVGKYHMTGHRSGWYHMIELYEKCGKVVHRPYSRCISSVQKLNKNSIEFFLSTQTRSGSKAFQSKFYTQIIPFDTTGL